MSRRHHHHIQSYEYDRFVEHSRDRERDNREQPRAIEYQDDSLSSINSDEESYLHHQHTKDKKNNFYSSKTEPSNKINKNEKSVTTESYFKTNSDGTSERLARLETMLEELIKRNNHPPEAAPTVNIQDKASSDRADRRIQFNLEPRRHDFTTSMWITKIQEVSIQNNWDEKTTISFMGSQMSGIIKAWYNSLPSYDCTWPEWKILITKMFPDNTDFITSLKRLVTRLKQADETVTTYYFSKMYLIEACKITGEDAVSCLIDGLNNQTIQEQAKAQNFLTPETLYSQFLMVLPEYTVDYAPTMSDPVWYEQEAIEGDVAAQEQILDYEKDITEEFDYHNKSNQGFHENNEASSSAKSSAPKRSAPVHSRLDKRFIRSNFRHPNKIPMAAKVCTICLNRGHLARNCRKSMLCCRVFSKKHSTYLYKICTINNYQVDAFVDTGSTSVIIKEGVASSLNLHTCKISDHLEVYGGRTVPVVGETQILLGVESVKAPVRAIIVPDNMQDVSVIIGQEFLNKKNVCVILQNESLNFFEASNKLTN